MNEFVLIIYAIAFLFRIHIQYLLEYTFNTLDQITWPDSDTLDNIRSEQYTRDEKYHKLAKLIGDQT